MTSLKQFGDDSRFSIALSWLQDEEPRGRRPRAHGWSMGALRIVVGGVTLTRNVSDRERSDVAAWYLSPLLEWFVANWAALLHEESFAWLQPDAAAAAEACRRALHRWIGDEDERGRTTYASVQAWYLRHGLRAAAEGGLLPDLFIRRLGDDVELSWTAVPPIFAGDGFVFVAEPARAMVAVEDVAGPLWEALRWAADHRPPDLAPEDDPLWERFARSVDRLSGIPDQVLQASYLRSGVVERLVSAGVADLGMSRRSLRAPAIEALSTEVLMFGGVSPDISQRDVLVLRGILDEAVGQESQELRHLVTQRGRSPLGVPYEDGSDFAADLLDDLGFEFEAGYVDVEAILHRLGIAALERSLDARVIRGIALAGPGISPRVVVNTTSMYNLTPAGMRFTLAHELCHILHDRTRARRVAHVSGPWVPRGFEQRANAFAAYLLMPRTLVLRHADASDTTDAGTVRRMAQTLGVSESALVEHLYNLELIGDWDREELRRRFRPTSP